MRPDGDARARRRGAEYERAARVVSDVPLRRARPEHLSLLYTGNARMITVTFYSVVDSCEICSVQSPLSLSKHPVRGSARPSLPVLPSHTVAPERARSARRRRPPHRRRRAAQICLVRQSPCRPEAVIGLGGTALPPERPRKLKEPRRVRGRGGLGRSAHDTSTPTNWDGPTPSYLKTGWKGSDPSSASPNIPSTAKECRPNLGSAP